GVPVQGKVCREPGELLVLDDRDTETQTFWRPHPDAIRLNFVGYQAAVADMGFKGVDGDFGFSEGLQ
ncbi:hypothetical protein, partial [Staphylococcus aureus]|uniref:hypothetical protein n=1 Tax=Staphylococcus aureus TaxID=1280 RepID=UPI0039BEC749